ncbi:hypothetical protein [Methylobacterium sp. 17Sr1-1]|uniref:hypothetical protein n=1 Tax=Methylobacterium sp. 17Sr1-1 TaxID=2202826 RepID=UPI000D6F06AB|nr:hypothetical protein [Methylobacterium sp. 17Sr1-1]AWN51586.1 hypothetical protein DK412_07685 [Methylobacterium sp. 17Sr1-1]
MPRILLAALALACVCSPAMAGAIPVAEILPATGTPAHGLAFGLILLGASAVSFAIFVAMAAWGVRYLLEGAPRWPGFALLAALVAVVWVGFGCVAPAFAAELAATDTTSVTLSAAPWISLLQEIVITAVIPAVAAYAIQAIRKVYPWAACSSPRAGWSRWRTP